MRSFSVSDNQDTLEFRDSRKSWRLSDPGLLLFWYWLRWSRVLEIAPKSAIWERVRLAWRKPSHSLPSRPAARFQGMSGAALLTLFLVHNQLNPSIIKRIMRPEASAIFPAVGRPVTGSASVFLPLLLQINLSSVWQAVGALP